jgi:hypothetical protein
LQHCATTVESSEPAHEHNAVLCHIIPSHFQAVSLLQPEQAWPCRHNWWIATAALVGAMRPHHVLNNSVSGSGGQEFYPAGAGQCVGRLPGQPKPPCVPLQARYGLHPGVHPWHSRPAPPRPAPDVPSSPNTPSRQKTCINLCISSTLTSGLIRLRFHGSPVLRARPSMLPSACGGVLTSSVPAAAAGPGVGLSSACVLLISSCLVLMALPWCCPGAALVLPWCCSRLSSTPHLALGGCQVPPRSWSCPWRCGWTWPQLPLSPYPHQETKTAKQQPACCA